jgi:hypothetical protein
MNRRELARTHGLERRAFTSASTPEGAVESRGCGARRFAPGQPRRWGELIAAGTDGAQSGHAAVVSETEGIDDEWVTVRVARAACFVLVGAALVGVPASAQPAPARGAPALLARVSQGVAVRDLLAHPSRAPAALAARVRGAQSAARSVAIAPAAAVSAAGAVRLNRDTAGLPQNEEGSRPATRTRAPSSRARTTTAASSTPRATSPAGISRSTAAPA